MHKYISSLLLTLSLLMVSFSAHALSIAMVVWRGQTDAETGFIAALEEQGHDVELTWYDAGQDRMKLGQLIRGELSENLDNYDYIYSFGTTVTKALKTHLNGRKPHIFNIVSFPAKAGILPSEQGGQKNTAGVSSRVPTEKQFTNAMEFMRLSKVVVAFNPREQNSTLQLQKAVELGKKYEFDVVPLRIRPDADVFMSDLQKLKKHLPISAIYLPSDSFLISNAEQIMKYVNENEIPSICAVSAYLKNGCLIGTLADYDRLGRLAAGIVEKHQQGVDISSLPVEFDTEPSPTISELTQEKLRIGPFTKAEK